MLDKIAAGQADAKEFQLLFKCTEKYDKLKRIQNIVVIVAIDNHILDPVI